MSFPLETDSVCLLFDTAGNSMCPASLWVMAFHFGASGCPCSKAWSSLGEFCPVKMTSIALG